MQIESLAARACVLSESSAPSQIIDGLGSADTLWQGAVAWDLKTGHSRPGLLPAGGHRRAPVTI